MNPILGDKFRLRFRKDGPLRFLSHLDLTRCVERMLRRANLSFKMTQGFHPTPRMIFALSMPLGVAGCREVLELELTEQREAEDVRTRLNVQSPDGLQFDSSQIVPMKASAVPRRMIYSLQLPAERIASVQEIAAQLVQQEKIWVARIKPRPRKLNIRPYVRGIHVNANDLMLHLDIWVTGSGTARADELIALLQLQDWLDAGAILARSELELRDEVNANEIPDQPPEGPPETAPPDAIAFPNHLAADAAGHDVSTATWGLSPNGPVVE